MHVFHATFRGQTKYFWGPPYFKKLIMENNWSNKEWELKWKISTAFNHQRYKHLNIHFCNVTDKIFTKLAFIFCWLLHIDCTKMRWHWRLSQVNIVSKMKSKVTAKNINILMCWYSVNKSTWTYGIYIYIFCLFCNFLLNCLVCPLKLQTHSIPFCPVQILFTIPK